MGTYFGDLGLLDTWTFVERPQKNSQIGGKSLKHKMMKLETVARNLACNVLNQKSDQVLVFLNLEILLEYRPMNTYEIVLI